MNRRLGLIAKRFHFLSFQRWSRALHPTKTQYMLIRRAISLHPRLLPILPTSAVAFKFQRRSIVPARETIYSQPQFFQALRMSTQRWTPPSPGDIPAPPIVPPNDIHSHGNLLEIKPKHIDINWTVDWDRKLIYGKVIHTVEVSKEGVDTFILDTSHLDITKVKSAGSDLKWTLGKRIGTLGSPLVIEIGSQKKGSELKVEIEYSTTKECTALGWLTAE